MAQDAPDTVTEALALLRNEGWVLDYQIVDGQLRAPDQQPRPPEDFVVDRIFRFEGPSAPGDEMIVLAVSDPDSGAKGTLATGYGPAADPDHLMLVLDMEKRHRG